VTLRHSIDGACLFRPLMNFIRFRRQIAQAPLVLRSHQTRGNWHWPGLGIDVINLMITKLGGLSTTMAAVKICEAGNVGCRLGAAMVVRPALFAYCG
jgi:hypothetical protein